MKRLLNKFNGLGGGYRRISHTLYLSRINNKHGRRVYLTGNNQTSGHAAGCAAIHFMRL